jgi:hypothetical protein
MRGPQSDDIPEVMSPDIADTMEGTRRYHALWDGPLIRATDSVHAHTRPVMREGQQTWSWSRLQVQPLQPFADVLDLRGAFFAIQGGGPDGTPRVLLHDCGP